MGVKMLGSRDQGGKNAREQGAHIIDLGSSEQRSRCGKYNLGSNGEKIWGACDK